MEKSKVFRGQKNNRGILENEGITIKRLRLVDKDKSRDWSPTVDWRVEIWNGENNKVETFVIWRITFEVERIKELN